MRFPDPTWTPQHSIALILVAVVVCAACGSRFAAVPGLTMRGAAVAEEGGVQVVASEHVPVRPCECPAVKVLLATIQNGTSRALSIRYEDLALRSQGGDVRPALPPFELASQEGASLPDDYPYPWSRFQVAPHLATYYRGFWHGSSAVEPDLVYYETHHAKLAALAVSVDELRRHALPEGLLEPGGYIRGLVYFVTLTGDEAPTLTAAFHDVQSGLQVVDLNVPLHAR